MSSPVVLAAVSRGIRSVIWRSISGNPRVRPSVGTEEAIVFLNPTQTARDSGNRLSLWLYQIAENEFTKNAPMVRSTSVDARGQTVHRSAAPPLSLDLFYLLTPFGLSAEADLLILGQCMQAVYDSSRLTLVTATTGPNRVLEDVGITWCRRSLEELSRIWEALQEPYRLSVCYQVRVTHIDSQVLADLQPVVTVGDTFGALDLVAGVP
jgi:hypothetical protein